jgi:sRNA-binding protein/8-oxo-dGTP pyrophosphatase MutT (NUDIX family)
MAQHRPRFRPSVTVAAVIEDGGRFLLVEEQTPEGLKLNNPAGHLEAGESPEQAVVREALEETGRDFAPEALLGVYLSRFVRQREAGRDEDVTYLRIAYRGRVGEPVEGRVLDRTIVRTLWLTADEIREQAARHRSPLVMRCIDDHLAGRALPLDAVHADGSLGEPEVKAPWRGDGPREAGSRRARRSKHNPRSMPETPAAESADPAAAAAVPVSAAPPAPDPGEAAPPEGAAHGEGGANAPAPPAAGPRPPRPPEPTLAETAAALAERFPALFTPGAFKPIKLRVQADIQERTCGAFTRKALSIFLHRHTTSTAYLKALVVAAQRYDLDGAEAGPLDEEHRRAAQAELDRRWQIVQERRAAERAAAAAKAPPREAAATPHAAAPGGPPRDGPRRRDGPPGGPRGDRPPRGEHREPRGDRGEPAPRADRHDRSDRPPRPDRRGPPERADRSDRPPRHDAAAARPRPPAPPSDPLPDDPERRERALLLRAWEGSTLTPANFCVLKRVDPKQFDALIEQARRERGERRAAAAAVAAATAAPAAGVMPAAAVAVPAPAPAAPPTDAPANADAPVPAAAGDPPA